MIKERERAVLTVALPEKGIEPGDIGTAVRIYRHGQAYEVEFLTMDGHTTAVITPEASQVRPVSRRENTHARELRAA